MRSKRQQWQLLTEHFDRLIELPEEQWDGELQALAESGRSAAVRAAARRAQRSLYRVEEDERK